MDESSKDFASVKARIDQIAEEVTQADIDLDTALSLYEEAVSLGLSACDLSEKDIFPEIEDEQVASVNEEEVVVDVGIEDDSTTDSKNAEGIEGTEDGRS